MGGFNCHLGFACGEVNLAIWVLLTGRRGGGRGGVVWLLGFAYGKVSRAMCGLLMGGGLTLPFEFWLWGA